MQTPYEKLGVGEKRVIWSRPPATIADVAARDNSLGTAMRHAFRWRAEYAACMAQDGLETARAPAERRRFDRALRVLIADDDHDTVELLALILRQEGHVVHTVLTGKDVLPAVRIFRPDAIVLDVAIPEMSGYAVA